MSANVQHEPMRAITEDLGLLSTKVGLRSERGTLIAVFCLKNPQRPRVRAIKGDMFK